MCLNVTSHAPGLLATHPPHRARTGVKKSRTRLLIGAAVLLADTSLSNTVSCAQSGAELPPVTVDAPRKRKPVRAAATATPIHAATVRQRAQRPTPPAPPTPSERAAAAAAAISEAKLA